MHKTLFIVSASTFLQAARGLLVLPETVKARLPLGSRRLSDIPLSDFLLVSKIEESDVVSKDNRHLQQLDIAEYNIDDRIYHSREPYGRLVTILPFSLAWPDRFFPFLFVVAEKRSGLVCIRISS